MSVNQNVNGEKLHRITEIIKHRGPDDEGYYFYNNGYEKYAYGVNTIKKAIKTNSIEIKDLYNECFSLGLGYRGLRVYEPFVDYHQPVTFNDITIVFDGNIYNYLEVNRKLEELGINFITNTYIETVVKAYMLWDEKCTNYFNGDWAFVIWDKNKKKLFCSRDRIGIKPFYYYFDGNKFIFSSEIKQIIEYGIKPKVNEKVLFAFLFYGFDNYSNETFFENIYSLGAGENIVISIDRDNSKLLLDRFKYWDINNSVRYTETDNFTTGSKIIGSALTKSIEHRFNHDLKIGSCLSGGLDSSSIVTIVCELLRNNNVDPQVFKTFTACYDDFREVDERYYSDLVVNNSGCTNIKVKPSSEKIKKDLEKLIWHQDEPFGSLSMFAEWCIMEAARQNGITILLSGQGGDETLLGYERYYAYLLIDKMKQFNITDAFKEFKLASENSRLNKKIVLAYLIYFNNIYIRKKRLKIQNGNFLNSRFIRKFERENIVDKFLKYNSLGAAAADAISNSILHLLRTGDRNAMAHSIELRNPFLDHEFIETAFNLPIEYKIRNGWTKACLREFIKDKMPVEVAYRKNKFGFEVPQEKWINELNDYFADLLLRDPLSHKYFNIKNIKELFDKKINCNIRFKFIVVEMWMKTFGLV